MPDHRDHSSGDHSHDSVAAGLAEAVSPTDFAIRGRRRAVGHDQGRRNEILRSLYSRIEVKVRGNKEAEVQRQAAEFIRLISILPLDVLEYRRGELELACDLIDVPHLKAPILQTLHATVVYSVERRGWLSGLIVRFAGTTPMQAVVSGLLLVLVFSILTITFSIFLHMAASGATVAGVRLTNNGDAINYLGIFIQNNLWMHEFFIAVHASMIGSIVSITVRINDFLNKPYFSVVRIFISIVLRPFIASAFTVFVIAAMQSGLLSFAGLSLDGDRGPFLAWVIGFLCGFSERLAEDFASKASSSIGGAEEFKKNGFSRHRDS